MRRIGSVVAVVAGFALLTGCSALQDAANTAQAAEQALTTAQVCAQAISAVEFNPASDPQAAVEQSQSAARELSDLAAQAADVTVAEAIGGVADTLMSVTLADFATPVEWLQQRTSQAADLLSACSGL
ncbi:bacteriophage spanin2 family protein [Actinokineospora sp. 24-640]